ncbi:hypothetical protein CYJ57_07415 [Falseniella ignava]|uniref:LysM domain-containing protein n=1 Tax=Falseniella ignava TaxID=137730 RepID=A0A2I1JW13_9LACT|nr:LysM peptidoglycan-binding domain-containing protein [Falseniella ignava]PKY87522.1 hypothetical protein CYJ57_07415 [Falseniella ignava]
MFIERKKLRKTRALGWVTATGIATLALTSTNLSIESIHAKEDAKIEWVANDVSKIREAILKLDKDDLYEIQWGDTLGAISLAAEVDIEDLAKVNGIEDIDFIKAGDELIINREVVKGMLENNLYLNTKDAKVKGKYVYVPIYSQETQKPASKDEVEKVTPGITGEIVTPEDTKPEVKPNPEVKPAPETPEVTPTPEEPEVEPTPETPEVTPTPEEPEVGPTPETPEEPTPAEPIPEEPTPEEPQPEEPQPEEPQPEDPQPEEPQPEEPQPEEPQPEEPQPEEPQPEEPQPEEPQPEEPQPEEPQPEEPQPEEPQPEEPQPEEPQPEEPQPEEPQPEEPQPEEPQPEEPQPEEPQPEEPQPEEPQPEEPTPEEPAPEKPQPEEPQPEEPQPEDPVPGYHYLTGDDAFIPDVIDPSLIHDDMTIFDALKAQKKIYSAPNLEHEGNKLIIHEKRRDITEEVEIVAPKYNLTIKELRESDGGRNLEHNLYDYLPTIKSYRYEDGIRYTLSQTKYIPHIIQEAFNQYKLIDHNELNEEFGKLLNAERASKGLPPIKHTTNAKAIAANNEKTYDNGRHGFLQGYNYDKGEFYGPHSMSTGQTTNDFYVTKDLDGAWYSGENSAARNAKDIFYLTDTKAIARDFFEQWKNSPGHYAYMMKDVDYDRYNYGFDLNVKVGDFYFLSDYLSNGLAANFVIFQSFK